MKWKIKNRFKVALLMANPPHTQFTIIGPIYGIADRRLVITVAPQNLICPHTSTYPMKAVAIDMINRMVPMFHVSLFLYEPK